MNYEPILAVLPDNKEDAKSMREIALAMSLDISSHASWIREQRMLARVLRILIKWDWAACDSVVFDPLNGRGREWCKAVIGI